RSNSHARLFTHTPSSEIHTLSLHDALPIFARRVLGRAVDRPGEAEVLGRHDETHGRKRRRDRLRGAVRGGVVDDDDLVIDATRLDRKSTRLNSSHVKISYAVFCLKKKKHND